MADNPATPSRIKVALFVDFDNIFSRLSRVDAEAARRFAEEPGRWLSWIERGMPGDRDDEAALRPRAVLVRKCYLNPNGAVASISGNKFLFHRYRVYFARCGFEVVDCPPLTAQGKNSADIRMVMDMLDMLEHRTRFDEFVIFSGDADFTSVLLRLRSHDRRTVVFIAGSAASAYKAACDRVVPEDIFMEDVLGLAAEEDEEEDRVAVGTGTGGDRVATVAPIAVEALVTPPPPENSEAGAAAPSEDDLHGRMAQSLLEQVLTQHRILAADLGRIVYKQFPEFRNSKSWLGFGGVRQLTEELVKRAPKLRLVEDGTTWAVTSEYATSEPEPAQRAAGPSRGDIIAYIEERVAQADEPIDMAKAALAVVREFGAEVLDSNWIGAGSFKNLLAGAEGCRFSVQTRTSPPVLFDPARHVLPDNRRVPDRGQLPAKIRDLARRVHQIVDTPLLTREQYAALFQAIADVLEKNTFQLSATSAAVFELLHGYPIERGHVTFVLSAISDASGPLLNDTPMQIMSNTFAGLFLNQVISRCGDAQLELSDEEQRLLSSWIVGGPQHYGG